MRPGRPPTPTILKLLAGNPGKRKLNRAEPKPPSTLTPCPPALSADARREWRRVSTVLHGLGLLTAIDRAALAAYCQAWARWLEAERQLTTAGAILTSPNGYPMPSPYLKIARDAVQQMRAFLTEFGMTPASRARLQVTPPDVPNAAGAAAEQRFFGT
jgi:P27 family predicted phage terminase small subunit